MKRLLSACTAIAAAILANVPADPGDLLGSLPLAYTAPRDIDAAPDGTLWLTDSAALAAVHIDANASQVLGAVNTRALGILMPTGIAVASDETLWIADWANLRLVRCNPDGSAPSSGLTEIDLDPLGIADPLGIDITSAGTFLVLDGLDGTETIYEISADGLSVLGTTSTSGLGATFPQGVTEASDGTMWVSESDSTTLYNASGGSPSTVDISGLGFDEPRGFAGTAGGTAWTIDGGLGVVREHTIGATPTLIDLVDLADLGLGLLSPTGLTRDPYGEAWIIDTNDGRAHRLSPDGSRSEISFDFTPWSATINEIDIAPSGTIYLTDPFNDTVHILTPDTSQTLGTITKTEIGSSALSAIAIDSDGTVWALDATALMVYHLNRNGSAVLGSFALNGGDIPNPTDIEVAPTGNLWIANQAGLFSNLHQLRPDGTSDPLVPTIEIGALHSITSPRSLSVSPDGDIEILNTGDSALISIEGPPPTIAQAIFVDSSAPSGVSQGDELVLVFDQPVSLEGTLEADDFVLNLVSDTLGTGFTAAESPLHRNIIILTLGSSPNLNVSGSGLLSSGIDVSSTLDAGDIVDAITGTDVSSSSTRDILFNFVEAGFSLIGPAGGSVSVVDSTDAVYREHTLTVAPGAVASVTSFEIAVPQVSTGLFNVVEIHPSSLAFLNDDSTLTMQYTVHDQRALEGGDETQMRIHQLEEVSPGVYQATPVPGSQTVDVDADLVTAPLSSTNANGTSGPALYATLPIDLVDDRLFIIDENNAAAAVIGRSSSGGSGDATLTLGGTGAYTRHQVVIPGYIESSQGITLGFKEATIFDRFGFPTSSGAVIVLESSSPLPVPVEVTLEFRDFPGSGDIVEMDGTPGARSMMRLSRRSELGGAFEFLALLPAHVDESGVVVTGLVADLTGIEGRAVYGLAVNPEASIPAELTLFTAE